MTAFTLDEIVAQLRAQGVPKERAEAVARRELGLMSREEAIRKHAHENGLDPEILLADVKCTLASVTVDAPSDGALEDVHVNEGRKLARALGGFVYSSVQKRRAKVTPGQPDTLMFFPRHQLMVWWEAKASWGRQSSAQQLFDELCEGCGAHYVCGTFEVFETWLMANGIGRKEPDGAWTPLPFHPLIEDRI